MFVLFMRVTLFLFLVAVSLTMIDLHRAAGSSRWTLRAWTSVFVVFFATLVAMLWGW